MYHSLFNFTVIIVQGLELPLLLCLPFEFASTYHYMNEKPKSEEVMKMIGGVIGQGWVQVEVDLEEEGASVLVRSGYHDQERDELDVGQLYAGRAARHKIGADDEEDEDHFHFLMELLEGLAPVGFAAE